MQGNITPAEAPNNDMIRVLREKPREWDVIRNADQLRTLLQEKLASRTFFLKGSVPPAEFNPGGAVEGGFMFYYADQVELPDSIVLYATLKRHLEIEFIKVSQPEAGAVVLDPVVGRIGRVNRMYPRLENVEAVVSAGHFQVSKSEIIIDNTRSQVANQVIFNEFERRLNQEFPGMKIYDFADRSRPPETRLLNKSTQSILVEDTSSPESFASRGPEFFDYGHALTEAGTFDEVRRRYSEDHVTAVLCMPLLIETPERAVPIAFMYCVARGEFRLDLSAHRRWLELSTEIIQRIGDANLLTVKEKQGVINVSEGGVALRIDHPDLRKYLPNQRWMNFDLVFRLQAPLRFQGRVVHVEDYGTHLRVGVDLEGSAHSDARTDVKQRLKNLIQTARSQIA